MNRISIIILNWNWWKDTIECLESLYRIEYQNYEVILVDNYSTNDSIEKIISWTKWDIEVDSKYFEKTKCTHELKIFEYSKEDLENWKYLQKKNEYDKLEGNKKLFLLKNDKNYGFAWWCNSWIRQVLSKWNSNYIFLLNNDTVIEKNYFNEIFIKLQDVDKQKIWCVWWKIFDYNKNDYRIKKYNHMNWISNVHELTGAWLLISVNSLKSEWLFDEYMFLYCEDYDLTYRISNKFNNYYIDTSSKLFHKSEASSNNIFEKKLILQIRNQFILYKRHNKYYSLKNFLRTILIFLDNNRKINLLISVKSFIIWVLKWIYEFIFNKWAIY